MNRLEEIKKEYEYIENTNKCSKCKYFISSNGRKLKSRTGECTKIGIKVKSFGTCRKYYSL